MFIESNYVNQSNRVFYRSSHLPRYTFTGAFLSVDIHFEIIVNIMHVYMLLCCFILLNMKGNENKMTCFW